MPRTLSGPGSLVLLGLIASSGLAAPAPDSLRAMIVAERFADAEHGARERVREIETAAPLDSLALGEALDLLVESLWRGGRATTPGAAAAAERAQELRERTAGVPPVTLANTLHQRANLLKAAGRFDGVRALYDRSLAIRIEALGPGHRDVARTLNDYGNLLLQMGAYAEAESLYLRSCDTYEKLGADQRRNLGKCLNNLAVLRQTAGDYARARPALERARQLFEDVLGPAHYNVATADVNLASLLLKTGDRDEAQALLARAVPIYEKAEGPEHPDVAWARRIQGEGYADAGDFTRARRSFETAAAIHEKSLGTAHPELALDLADLARIELAAGRDSAAEAHLLRALDIHERALGTSHASVARDLELLGRLRAKRGDLAGARDLLVPSLTIRETALGPDHPEVANSLMALAAVAWARGDRDSAVVLALRAESISREHLRLTLRSLPERQALAVARERVRGLDLALSIRGAGADTALADAIVRSRAVVLDELIRRGQTASAAVEPERADLAVRLAAARDRLARVTVRGPGNDPPERYRAIRDDALKAREQAERELAEASLRYRFESRERDAGLTDVRMAMPEGSALVHFVLFDRSADSTEWLERAPAGLPSTGKAPARGRRVPTYLALVVGAGGDPPTLVPIGSAATIDSLVARWLRETTRVHALPAWQWADAETQDRRAGERLRRAVWDPLRPLLAGADRVFVVCDGALELVPLGALPAERGYLVEHGPTVHRLTAARDLVGSREHAAAARGLVAVGAPDFDAGLSRRATPATHASNPCAPAWPQFRKLPASGVEARWVAGYWNSELKKLHPGSAAGDSALALTGAAATEQTFKRLAPGTHVLHLATHGLVVSLACLSERQASPAEPSQEVSLGGLAFAGANAPHRDGEEDGILTAEEIAGLDLRASDWAVLSACNSGTGEVLRGEGVAGLRRAFEVAGCRGLVMSLWPVEDKSAEDWMRALYEARYERRLATDEAVRAASRALLDRRRREGASTHPFAWAGFVAAGEWR